VSGAARDTAVHMGACGHSSSRRRKTEKHAAGQGQQRVTLLFLPALRENPAKGSSMTQSLIS
jgi:hypothetical protein